jgi:hypothetical protein
MRILGPEDLGAIREPRALDEILEDRGLVAAFGTGVVKGFAAAALLFSDYAVLHESATLLVDTPEAWAGASWRLERRTLRWALNGAKAQDIVDEITALRVAVWAEEWMRHRSVMALDSAALLIRSNGGARLERVEFARLFAAGEPQKGLTAFLTKTKPVW